MSLSRLFWETLSKRPEKATAENKEDCPAGKIQLLLEVPRLAEYNKQTPLYRSCADWQNEVTNSKEGYINNSIIIEFIRENDNIQSKLFLILFFLWCK